MTEQEIKQQVAQSEQDNITLDFSKWSAQRIQSKRPNDHGLWQPVDIHFEIKIKLYWARIFKPGKHNHFWNHLFNRSFYYYKQRTRSKDWSGI